MSLQEFLKSEIQRLLKEDDQEMSFEEMQKYLDNEVKTLKVNIDNAKRSLSAIRNPLEKQMKMQSIKKAEEKIKQLAVLKTNIKGKEQQAMELEKNQQELVKAQQSAEVQASAIAETIIPAPATAPVGTAAPAAPVPAEAPQKTVIVKFDTKTQQPFEVKFTERGFLIDDTRLSFEALEHALSKNYNIHLKAGNGLALDPIKMQKILKYKGRF